MHRQFPALLALLLVVAGVGVAPAAPAPDERAALQPVVDEPNTTSYLGLDEPVRRSGFATAELDVATSLAADNAAIHGRYERHRLDQRYRDAPNDTARRQVLRAAADDLDARTERVADRERALLAAYSDGELSTETYLRRLALLTAEAGHLQSATARLYLRVEAVQGTPVSTERIAGFKARLAPVQGPVRERVRRAMAARADPERVYLETSDDGVAAAMVVDSDRPDSRFVRQAHVSSARDPDAADRFADSSQPLEAAVTRAEEFYPWAFDRHQGYTVGLFGEEPFLYRAGVYAIGVNHPHGTDRQFDLVTYLDGGTTDAFYEVQYKSPDSVPTERLGNNSTDRLALTVNATVPGGPMQATVTDNASTPVDATVYVDGHRLGTTGDDGERWFVAPRGRVNVTAVADGERLTVAGTPPNRATGT